MKIAKGFLWCICLIAVIPVFGCGSSSKVEVSHNVAYLIEGARWQDSSGQIYRNSKDIQIEVWSREVVTSEGEKLTQIYFLEGENQGLWGYVDKRFISSYVVKKSKK